MHRTMIIQYVIFNVNSTVCPACISGVFDDQMFWIVKGGCGWFHTKHMWGPCAALLNFDIKTYHLMPGHMWSYHSIIADKKCSYFEEHAFKLRYSDFLTQWIK